MPVIVRCRLPRTNVREGLLKRVTRNILEATGESKSELSLELVGNHRIQRLNRHYRNQDRPTDVLAFPLGGPPGRYPRLLGDVVISLPMAKAQAAQFRCSVDEELVRLVIHGTLHLLGYDHELGEQEARRMKRKERAILRRLRPLPKIINC